MLNNLLIRKYTKSKNPLPTHGNMGVQYFQFSQRNQSLAYIALQKLAGLGFQISIGLQKMDS